MMATAWKRTAPFIYGKLGDDNFFRMMAGDAEAGKVKSATCMHCHGAQGISATDIWPNLAGQKEGYLVKQMKAFRDGTRNDPTMSPMATGLADEDIDDLAAFYSALGR